MPPPKGDPEGNVVGVRRLRSLKQSRELIQGRGSTSKGIGFDASRRRARCQIEGNWAYHVGMGVEETET